VTSVSAASKRDSKDRFSAALLCGRCCAAEMAAWFVCLKRCFGGPPSMQAGICKQAESMVSVRSTPFPDICCPAKTIAARKP